MTRGASQAVKDAKEYLKMYPDTPVKKLADKFGIDPSTVYRWLSAQKKEKK